MINATVEVTRLKRVANPQTGVARADARREKSMDFRVECSGPASDALSQCRKAFAEKYDLDLEKVRASFAADKRLNKICLIFQG